MTASATIDITTYTQPAVDTTSNTKNFNADNSSGFANALDNANKTYSAPKNQATASTTNQKQELQDNNAQSNNIQEKPKNADKDTKNITENETSKSENNNEIDQPQEQKTDSKSESQNSSEQDVNQQANQQQSDQSETTANTDDTKPVDETLNVDNVSLPIENIIQNLSTAVQAQVDNTTVNTNQPASTQNNQAQAVQAQASQENLNIDLTNLTGNLPNKAANANADKANNVQVQTQTQQALSNVKINTQDAQPQVKTDSTTPVISTSSDAVTVDAKAVEILTDKNNIAQDAQNTQNKTALTQEVIDKTNAQVVSVETSDTSNSNSNNFLNNQNAQEQVVKLAIANNSNDKTQDTKVDINQALQNNVLETQNAMPQTNLTQSINNAQAQQPKELNKTDILSQINNQINTKQLQSGETTKVNIILQPENLGKITLELVNSKEGLTAKLTTDNEQVKEILSKHLDNLKDTMSNQGVNVGNITVKVDETQKQSNEQSSFEHWQAKQDGQEFSNNAQNQNQKEFSFDEQVNNATGIKADADIDNDTNVESEITTEIGVEKTVSVSTGSNSGRVDYKV